MPVKVENKLKARARSKGFKGKRFKAYVYGTMNKLHLLAAIHPRLVELAKKIDLGEKWNTEGCSPCGPSWSKPTSINYPRLYISGKKEPVDIPETGKAIVDYKVTNRSMNKNNDEERHSIDIEVHSIEPVEDDHKPPKEGEPARLLAQSALEDLRKLRRFADPRPRNSLGEYASDPGEGVDPNQMAAAYGPPDVSQSHMERVKRFFLKRRQATGAAATE